MTSSVWRGMSSRTFPGTGKRIAQNNGVKILLYRFESFFRCCLFTITSGSVSMQIGFDPILHTINDAAFNLFVHSIDVMGPVSRKHRQEQRYRAVKFCQTRTAYKFIDIARYMCRISPQLKTLCKVM